MPDPKDILIVDDMEENVVFISEILEEQGHSFRTARNGKEAMTALRDKRPDLVLLDIMMPRKSGVVVLTEMRKDDDLKSVPVIIVSGASDVTGVSLATGEKAAKETYADDMAQPIGMAIHEKLEQLRPDGLIEKPIDPESLVAKINEILP